MIGQLDLALIIGWCPKLDPPEKEKSFLINNQTNSIDGKLDLGFLVKP